MTPEARTEAALASVVDVLELARLPMAVEADCQREIARRLAARGLRAVPEYDLCGRRGRIDFWLSASGVGVEVKVGGGPTDVLRQLLRYAGAEQVTGLVLVTARLRLARGLPDMLRGKPLRTVATWRGAL